MNNNELVDRYLDGLATQSEIAELENDLSQNRETADSLVSLAVVQAILNTGSARLLSEGSSSMSHPLTGRGNLRRRRTRAVLVAAFAMGIAALAMVIIRSHIEPNVISGAGDQIAKNASEITRSKRISLQSDSEEIRIPADPELSGALRDFVVSFDHVASGRPLYEDLSTTLSNLKDEYDSQRLRFGSDVLPEFDILIEGDPGARLIISDATGSKLRADVPILTLARFHGALSGYKMEVVGRTLRFTTRPDGGGEIVRQIDELPTPSTDKKVSETFDANIETAGAITGLSVLDRQTLGDGDSGSYASSRGEARIQSGSIVFADDVLREAQSKNDKMLAAIDSLWNEQESHSLRTQPPPVTEPGLRVVGSPEDIELVESFVRDASVIAIDIDCRMIEFSSQDLVGLKVLSSEESALINYQLERDPEVNVIMRPSVRVKSSSSAGIHSSFGEGVVEWSGSRIHFNPSVIGKELSLRGRIELRTPDLESSGETKVVVGVAITTFDVTIPFGQALVVPVGPRIEGGAPIAAIITAVRPALDEQ